MLSRHKVRTVTRNEVLVDEVRETPVDQRLSRNRTWMAIGLLFIVVIVLAV